MADLQLDSVLQPKAGFFVDICLCSLPLQLLLGRPPPFVKKTLRELIGLQHSQEAVNGFNFSHSRYRGFPEVCLTVPSTRACDSQAHGLGTVGRVFLQRAK